MKHFLIMQEKNKIFFCDVFVGKNRVVSATLRVHLKCVETRHCLVSRHHIFRHNHFLSDG